MLIRLPVVVLGALVQSAWSASCPPGSYLTNKGVCTTCPSGSISTKSNSNACAACAAGQTNNSDRTQCVGCGDGTYSTGGTICMSCPAGQESASDHKSCQKCSPGKFNPAVGSMCQECPAGKFSNVSGAKSCCDCCAGWYSDTTGSRSCKQCSNSKKYGPVDSSSSTYCTNSQGNLPEYATSCDMSGNVCPSTTPGGPQGSPVTRKRRDVQCSNGFEPCPRYSGRGGFDCIDTQNNPESCGGCIDLDGQGTGTDCTAIQGVGVTRCVKKSCVIDSCRKGWVKSLDGASCVPDSHTTRSSKLDNLHARAKRSTAKRAIRANIY